MFSRRSSLPSLLAFALLSAISAAAQGAPTPPGSIDQFRANLPSYSVTEGAAIQVDPVKLCCGGSLPKALFFNRSAPYVAFSVENLSSPLSEFRQLPIFQLRADEAIVMIGVTPPEAKFFAYQPYLLARYYPPETKPKPIFASLGDTINLSTIKTIGPDHFNRPVVIIFTPDQGTDRQIRAALHKAGYPDAIINTLVIPSSMLHMGLNPASDDIFIIISRMAMFADKTAGQAYLDAMKNTDPTKRPIRIFRATPTSSAALNPFPAPPLRIRGTGTTEMDLTPALSQLRQSIIDYWDQRGYKATEYHSRHTGYDGNEYIQRVKNVLGDTRDSLYMTAGYLPMWDLGNPEDHLTLNDNDFLVAYGPKHVATGKATYTNINVYASDVMFSLASVYSDSFEGSSEQYMQGPAAGMLYAYKFARPGHCENDFCVTLEVPPNCVPWCDTPGSCPTFVLDSDTQLGIFFRNYLEPPTRVGPAASELLYDQVIKFSPK